MPDLPLETPESKLANPDRDPSKTAHGQLGGRSVVVPPEVSIAELARILRRRRLSVLLVVLIVTCSAAAYVFSRKPVFLAEAVLVVDTAGAQSLSGARLLNPLLDFPAVRSELDFLASSQFTRRFIERAGLAADPEFNRRLSPSAGLLSVARQWISDLWRSTESLIPAALLTAVKAEFSTSGGGELGAAISAEDPEIGEIIETVQRRLRLLNDGRSYTIRVQLEAQSAVKAARLVNVLVDGYLEEKSVAKTQSLDRRTEWIAEMIEAQKLKVRESDSRAQQFRERYQLTESRGSTVLGQQISELTTQLTLVRAERAQSEAKYRQVMDQKQPPTGFGAASEVLTSPLIQRLREQQSDLLRREAELSATYGPKHPRLINARAEIQDIERKIDAELAKTLRSVASDAEMIRRREAALAGELDALRKRQDEGARAEVTLRELERNADQNRVLLQSYVSQMADARAAAAQLRPDTLLISPAEPPSFEAQSKGGPILLASFLASLFLGAAVAMTIDRLDGRCYSAERIEREFGVRVIGFSPEIQRRLLRRLRPQDYVIDRPNSVYAEAIGSTMTSIRVALRLGGSIVVLVTSSTSGEGKTSFSASLAQKAASEGRRVLLIDADGRLPSPGVISPAPQQAPMQDPESFASDIFSEAISVDPRTGLHSVDGLTNRYAGPQVLKPSIMEGLISAARQNYDLIVIDASPVTAKSDVVMLSTLADVTLLLIQWRNTTRGMVANALAQLSLNERAQIGIVLSRIDLEKHRALGYRDRAAQYGLLRGYYQS